MAANPNNPYQPINSTNYQHPSDPALNDIHQVLEYNVLGEPVLRTTLGPTAGDAFGRFRTSTPYTLYDNFHRYSDNEKVATITASGGSTVHESYSSSVNMIVNGSLGSKVYRETVRTMAYQPGKSLLYMGTFVMAPGKSGLRQRVGYFDSNDGFYLEKDGQDIYFVKRSSSVNGTPQETKIIKDDWNITPLDGTGADKIIFNPDVAQILYIQIEWLGVGTATLGFVINGQLIPCHKFNWANEEGSTTTYMGTACLPVRSEIENTSSTGSSDSMKIICNTVISEGGYELRGRPLSVGHNIISPRTTVQAENGQLIPMISIRLKSNNLGAIVVPKNFSFAPITSASYEFFLIGGCTTSGGTWVSAGSESSVEYNLTPTVLSGGKIYDHGYVLATNQSSVAPNLEEYPFKFQLERNTLTTPATRYEFVIATRTTTNSTAQCISLRWEEIT